MVMQKSMIKNIWMLSREYGDLAGAGGVKDVVCQLAEALARWTGRSLHVVLPMYGFIQARERGFVQLEDPVCAGHPLQLSIDMHEPHRTVYEQAGFYWLKENRVNIYLVDADRFREKSDVYTYTETDEQRVWWQKKASGHHDYFAMNLLLQKAALELMVALGEIPDIIHCHDGHTAVLPALIREISGYRSYFRQSACLVTIHNAGYGYHQEIADKSYARTITGLPEQVLDSHLLDRKFDPFLTAGHYALLNTVSENYARELQETDSDHLTGWLGHELLNRGVRLEGITNGIDPCQFTTDEKNRSDRKTGFDPLNIDDELDDKRYAKEALLNTLADTSEIPGVEQFGALQVASGNPLFTFIGRLSEQKGIDIISDMLPEFLGKHQQAMMLILGSGSEKMERSLISLATSEHLWSRICFLRGFHPGLAKKVFAAGDFFLIPSRYEPCGLTDFIAQLFGNIPVVHHVGGLVKVRDGVTGIAYHGNQPADLFEAMERGLHLYENSDMRRAIQVQAVAEIEEKYTWKKVMKRYLDLYRMAWEKQVCPQSEG